MVVQTASLDAVIKEAVDLENIPPEEVFDNPNCTGEGLNSGSVKERLVLLGYNKLEEKKESQILKFLGFMWNPLSWVMEAAAIIATVLANGGGKGPDYHDFVGIVLLLIINSTISFIEENNTGNAAAPLMTRLAPPKAKVLRDEKWSKEDAAVLVPRDIISIKLGDIIPTDARRDPLKIDQLVTRLPIPENHFQYLRIQGMQFTQAQHASRVKLKQLSLLLESTLSLGKQAHLVENTTHVGHFQKVSTAIGNFCICSIAVGIVIEIMIIYGVQKRKYRVGIDNLLVLLIGGIPIAMPTVLPLLPWQLVRIANLSRVP